jgi:hypothetical protein
MSGDHKTLIKGNPSQYVKLNVGGFLHYTTIATLTKNDSTMLSAMFSGRLEVLTDSEGICSAQAGPASLSASIFSPEYFRLVWLLRFDVPVIALMIHEPRWP